MKMEFNQQIRQGMAVSDIPVTSRAASSFLSTRSDGDSRLFKWSVKFGHRIESFVFLSPTQLEERGLLPVLEAEESTEVNDLKRQMVYLAFQCLKDAILRHRMLIYFVNAYHKLESISITDLNKQGRLYLGGEKLVELRDWIFTASVPELTRIDLPVRVKQWYVPMLSLPDSTYVMKGATLVLMEMVDQNGKDDMEVTGADFEEDGEGVFGEALVEIIMKHKSRMKTLR